MTYGYIRVSIRDQNEDRQLAALSAFDIPEKNLFMDKQSGKDFYRPAYQRLIKTEAGRPFDHQKYRPAGTKL